MHVVKGQVKYTLTGLEDVLLAVAALGDGVTIASASQVPVSLSHYCPVSLCFRTVSENWHISTPVP